MKLIIFLILFFDLFYKSTFHRADINENCLSSGQMLSLRGFFAMWVVFCHIGSQRIAFLDNIYGVLPLGYGDLAVAFFFFLSGFGVQKSYMQRKDAYRRSFLQKRASVLALPYLLLIGLYWCGHFIIDKTYGFAELLDSFRVGVPLVANSWFLIALALFYLLYYLEMLLLGDRYRLILAVNIALNLLWVFVVKLLHWGYWWYAFTTALSVGIAYAIYEKRILALVRKYYGLLLTADFLGFCASCAIFRRFEKMIVVQAMNLSFVALVVLICMRFTFRARLLPRLGKISFELYTIHGLFILLIPPLLKTVGLDAMSFPAVVLLSCAAAALLHPIFTEIQAFSLKLLNKAAHTHQES